MGDDGVVDVRGGAGCDGPDIAGDPFIGVAGIVWPDRGIAFRGGAGIGRVELACVEEDGGAIRKNVRYAALPRPVLM